jgi:hypothetical protein
MKEEPIVAEGLFRNALSKIKKSFRDKPHNICALEYARCSRDFGDLLTRLSWNNTTRSAEAEKVFEEMKHEVTSCLPHFIETNPDFEYRLSFWEWNRLNQ